MDPIPNLETAGQTESGLVRAAQAGSRAAFDQLVLRHKDRLFGLCYWLLGDYEESNDAAQESFLKAYRSLAKFRLDASFGTWLYRIAVNTCKNRMKSAHRRFRRKTVSMDNPGEGRRSPLEVADDALSPMMAMEKREQVQKIKDAIEELPPEQRMVVALRDIQGFTYEEVADLSGVPVGTVKSRLSRARMDLRDRLKDVI